MDLDAREKALRLRKLELEEEELTLKQRELDAKRQKLDQEHSADDDQVTLNVGGKHFTTTRTTLRKASFFENKLDGPFKPSLFIDRSSKAFPLVLEFLRTGSVSYSLAEAERRTLLDEASYYGIESLVCHLKGETDPSQMRACDQEAREREKRLVGAYCGEVTETEIHRSEEDLIDIFQHLGDFKRKDPTDLELPLVLDAHVDTDYTADVTDCFCDLRPTNTFALSSSSSSSTTKAIFRERFNKYSGGLLDDLDLANLVFAGGSVLTCLTMIPTDLTTLNDALKEVHPVRTNSQRCKDQPVPVKSKVYDGDIDIFLVGLSAEEAVRKLEQIGTQKERQSTGEVGHARGTGQVCDHIRARISIPTRAGHPRRVPLANRSGIAVRPRLLLRCLRR
jgi:hypothetical protein